MHYVTPWLNPDPFVGMGYSTDNVSLVHVFPNCTKTIHWTNFYSEKKEELTVHVWNSPVPFTPHAMYNNMAIAADHNLTLFSHMVNQACHSSSCNNMYGLIGTLSGCYNLW